MIVKELIELLKTFDPNMRVILQRDSEGNGYSPLVSGEEALYKPTSTWGGECYAEDDEEVDPSKYERVIVLWPNG